MNYNGRIQTSKMKPQGFLIEDTEELNEGELRITFKMALKRLVKFQEKERKTLNVVPPVREDLRCIKEYECLKKMPEKGKAMGFELRLEL